MIFRHEINLFWGELGAFPLSSYFLIFSGTYCIGWRLHVRGLVDGRTDAEGLHLMIVVDFRIRKDKYLLFFVSLSGCCSDRYLM